MSHSTNARFVHLLAAVTVLPLALMGVANSPPPAQAAPPIPSPERLTADWWQWVLGISVSKNPAFDPTGDNALADQPYANQGLIFLCGSFESDNVHRTITVPAGTAFFLPVVNTQNDKTFYDRPVSVPRMRADSAADMDGTHDRFAVLNGVPLPVERLVSPVFPYKLPKQDNIAQYFGLDVSGTVAPAVADGYWSSIPPLSRGQYELSFGGTFASGFAFTINYTIVVQ